MRKKGLLLLLLAALLLILLLVRGCGKKNEENTPEENAPTVSVDDGQAQTEKTLFRGTLEAASESGGVTLTITRDGASETHIYTDVQLDDWFADAVNCAVANEWMSGTEGAGGTEQFRPDYGITRAEFAMILYRMADAEPVAAHESYSDVASDAWYYDCVSWAAANGFILPTGDGAFGAGEFISCEEMLTALHRAAGEPDSTASLEDYPYAPKVSEDGLTAVRWAWQTGLIAEDECVWYPTQAVSRAQVALLLTRYNEL